LNQGTIHGRRTEQKVYNQGKLGTTLLTQINEWEGKMLDKKGGEGILDGS